MSLFTGAWNFVRRHRRKIVVLGIVVGSAALFKRYVDNKLAEWAANERAECLERLKREQHFDSTRQTCRTTVANLMHNLSDRVLVLCDCESLTNRLKNHPSNRLELWEQLKRSTFVRLLVEVHGAAVLVTLLNIQLNIVGGYMFVDATSSSSDDDVGQPRLPRTIQQRYLTIVQNFFEDGLSKHLHFVQSATDKVVGDVSLKETMTIAKIQQLLMDVEHALEEDADALIHKRVLDLLKSAPKTDLSVDDDRILSRVMDETMDLVESDDYRKVLGLTVQTGFNVISDALFGYFASVPDAKERIENFANPNEIGLPMAKVIPMMTALGQRLLIGGDLSEHFLSAMFASEAQRTMSANIYESFSQRGRDDGP